MCRSCEPCNVNNEFVCKESGNFYTTGEYHRITSKYNITGDSLYEQIQSVKTVLDYDTLEILKVLLQDNDIPCSHDLQTDLETIANISFIQECINHE